VTDDEYREAIEPARRVLLWAEGIIAGLGA